jgi:polar amino acid transport system permease protein
VIYSAAPRDGLALSAYWSGLVGLVIYGSAYFAEIYRAGFNSIPHGQVEAARILGLSKVDITARIKLPQMLRLIIPPTTNEVIVLIKESAVLSIITVPELTNITGRVVNETFTVIQPYLAAGVLYWIFVEGVSRMGIVLERVTQHYAREAR